MQKSSVRSSIPESLGHVDPAILYDLSDTFDNEFCDEWVDANQLSEIDNVHSDFLDIVSPVTKKFTKYVLDTVGVEPPQIRYHFVSGNVSPNQAHIIGNWHLDGFDPPDQVAIFSNAIQPEFIVSDEISSEERLNKIASEPLDFDLRIERMIEQGQVDIYKPDSNTLTVATNNFHRSAKNKTKVSVFRNFLAVMSDFSKHRP